MNRLCRVLCHRECNKTSGLILILKHNQFFFGKSKFQRLESGLLESDESLDLAAEEMFELAHLVLLQVN